MEDVVGEQWHGDPRSSSRMFVSSAGRVEASRSTETFHGGHGGDFLEEMLECLSLKALDERGGAILGLYSANGG